MPGNSSSLRWTKELEIAKHAALEAGKAIIDIYKKEADISVEYKKDDSPLTAADKNANHYRDYFEEAFSGLCDFV